MRGLRQSVCGWCRLHSPLVIAVLVAVVLTLVSMYGATNQHPWWLSWAPGLSGGAWEIVMLLVIFDITPKTAKEKQETGGAQ